MVVPAGTQHQFVNTGPTPLVRPAIFCIFPYSSYDSVRFCTQSILQRSMILRQCIRPRKREMKRRRTARTKPLVGPGDQKSRTKKRDLSGLTASMTNLELATQKGARCKVRNVISGLLLVAGTIFCVNWLSETSSSQVTWTRLLQV